MATSKAWRELIRKQQEKLTTTEAAPAEVTVKVPTAPGVCVCGRTKFRLVYIDHQLHRICRHCETTIVL